VRDIDGSDHRSGLTGRDGGREDEGRHVKLPFAEQVDVTDLATFAEALAVIRDDEDVSFVLARLLLEPDEQPVQVQIQVRNVRR